MYVWSYKCVLPAFTSSVHFKTKKYSSGDLGLLKACSQWWPMWKSFIDTYFKVFVLEETMNQKNWVWQVNWNEKKFSYITCNFHTINKNF